MLGDQQAALVRPGLLRAGEAKCTYGTGDFLLLNTGERSVPSSHGLITGVAYRLGDGPPVYMLEGSVAVTGALVQWLRDNLGVIGAASEVEALAASVPDSDGCVIVPAFSGLFAPRWRPDARGVICGLTQFHTKAHLARAALDATAYATREVVDAMVADAGVALPALRVDGGMTANDLLLQIQADVLGRAGRTACRDRDDGARRGLRGGPRGRLLELAGRAARRTSAASAAGIPARHRRSASAVTPSGTRPSNGRSAGSSSPLESTASRLPAGTPNTRRGLWWMTVNASWWPSSSGRSR